MATMLTAVGAQALNADRPYSSEQHSDMNEPGSRKILPFKPFFNLVLSVKFPKELELDAESRD